MTRFDNLFRPDEFYTDLFQIDFPGYYLKGFRLVLLDIDNTLARHGSSQADEYARTVVDRIKTAGFQCWIISNGGRRRVLQYAASLGLPCVPKANKPSTKGLRLACQSSGVKINQAMMIGDQILTDIISANRAGCRSLLVHPRFSKEAWNVWLKRFLEKFFYHRYKLK